MNIEMGNLYWLKVEELFSQKADTFSKQNIGTLDAVNHPNSEYKVYQASEQPGHSYGKKCQKHFEDRQ